MTVTRNTMCNIVKKNELSHTWQNHLPSAANNDVTRLQLSLSFVGTC